MQNRPLIKDVKYFEVMITETNNQLRLITILIFATQFTTSEKLEKLPTFWIIWMPFCVSKVHYYFLYFVRIGSNAITKN